MISRYSLALLLVCLIAVPPAWSDTVTLTSGEMLSGKIRSETEESVTMEVTVEGITDERVIPRSDIENIDKVEADELAFERIRRLKPDPQSSYTQDMYDRMITSLRSFIEKNSSSPHVPEARDAMDALAAEKKRVIAREVKYLGRWLTSEEAEERKVQIEAQQLLAQMRELAGRGDFIGALNTFDQIEKRYSNTRSFPAAIELARHLTALLRSEIERRQRAMKTAEENFKKGLALTPEGQKPQLLAARKREQDQAAAAIAAAEKAGLKWKPLMPRSEKSLEVLMTTINAETPRLASLPVARMRASLDKTQEAKADLEAADFAAAEAKLKEAQQLWASNEEMQYWTKQATQMKTAAAATPSGSPDAASPSPGASPAPGIAVSPHAAATTPPRRGAATPSPAPGRPAAASPSPAGTTEEKPFYMTVKGAAIIVGAVLALLAISNLVTRLKARKTEE